MRRRVTDQRLIHTVEDPLGQEADDYYAMADELRQRRAADLSDSEREALAFAMVVMTAGTKWEHAMHDPVVRDHVENCRRSIAALDKLTSKPGGE